MRDVVLSAHGAEHLELEELAAFLDGHLREERRAQVRQHLGECPDCYELFDETAQLQREMEPGVVIPGPFRVRQPWGLWVGYAAAAVVVLGVGIGVYRDLSRPADVSVGSLAASLQSRMPQIEQQIWQSRMRGTGQHVDEGKLREPSFQVGVELINLQVGLEGGDAQTASGATANINGILDDFLFDDRVTNFYKDLNVQLEKTPPRALAQRAAKMGDSAFRDSALDPIYVDFGKWTEAGRLAAVAHVPGFFAQRGVRRFPRELRKKEGKDLPPEVAKALEPIEQLLDREELTASDYDALREAFSRSLRIYYPRGEPFENEGVLLPSLGPVLLGELLPRPAFASRRSVYSRDRARRESR